MGTVTKAEDLEPYETAVADALKLLHSRGLFHYDLHMGNVLFETNGSELRAWIIDFGLSKRISSSGGRDPADMQFYDEHSAEKMFLEAKKLLRDIREKKKNLNGKVSI
jgi:tRNA A-37 threonylcarbamoyl transferase component Bud32